MHRGICEGSEVSFIVVVPTSEVRQSVLHTYIYEERDHIDIDQHSILPRGHTTCVA